MTTLREAAQQALEALEKAVVAFGPGLTLQQNAIAALKAALAEQDDDLTAAWMAGAAEERKRAEQAQPVPGCRRVKYRCRDCGHEQWVHHVIAADGSEYAGSGRNWCDKCERGLPQIVQNVPPAPQPLTIERLRYALAASRVVPPEAVEDADNYDDGVMMSRIDALYRRIK